MEKSAVIIKQSPEVDPDIVWGDHRKVVEIIGLGSGDGFEIKNANLPKEWELSLPYVNPEGFADFHAMLCKNRSLYLQEMSFDPNKILTEAIIRDKDNNLSRLYLAENWVQLEKGKYVVDNLHKIGAAVIFQAMISRYLGRYWGNDFDYGYIDGCGDNGYGPIDLRIPEDIFENGNQITNELEQNSFINGAHNIAGRFGLELTNMDFDKRGILHTVNVTGDRAYYSLEDCGRNKNRQYVSHNIDTATQAAALHGIVASHINYLLEKEIRNKKI